MHRGVGAHHRPVQVEGFEKLPEGGDLWLNLSGYPLLSQDRAAVLVQGKEEAKRR